MTLQSVINLNQYILDWIVLLVADSPTDIHCKDQLTLLLWDKLNLQNMLTIKRKHLNCPKVLQNKDQDHRIPLEWILNHRIYFFAAEVMRGLVSYNVCTGHQCSLMQLHHQASSTNPPNKFSKPFRFRMDSLVSTRGFLNYTVFVPFQGF